MLKQSYVEIKKSIVAIALTRKKPGDFFTIIGTGFFIREDGIILTNKHVLDVINNLPIVKAGGNPYEEACVLFFSNNEIGMQLIALKIDYFLIPDLNLEPEAIYYGNKQIDLGIIVLKDVKDCPIVKIYKGNYTEGESIGTAGFPLGVEALNIPGWIHQLGPTLRKGIISAVLPFNANSPHALLLDIMLQGGASGSPVFLSEKSEVIGIIDSGIDKTNFSYCIPSNLIKLTIDGLKKISELEEEKRNKTPLKDWMSTKKIQKQIPKEKMIED